jgi:hypothetical protein
MDGFFRLGDHATGDADAQHVHPALVKIEQMRIQDRAHDILDHDDEPDPRREAGVTKQQEVGAPHRIEDGTPSTPTGWQRTRFDYADAG